MKSFSLIVAMDDKRGIGKNANLAWHLPADLKRFKAITSAVSNSAHRNAVIMGRKTWESLPEKFRPLPNRLNVVLTRGENHFPSGVLSCSQLDEAILSLDKHDNIESVFVIGGAQVFTQAMNHGQCRKIYITRLLGDFHCDVFFPPISSDFQEVLKTEILNEGELKYQFIDYQIPPK